MVASEPRAPVRILHLSDLHFRADTAWDREPVLRHLAAAIGAEVAQGLAPDLVAITGDLAHSGKAAEYALARRWLAEALWPTLSAKDAPPLPRDRLLLVPGNHDVDREAVDEIAEAVQGALLAGCDQDRIAKILGSATQRKVLLKRHNAYLAFYAKWLEPDAKATRPLPWWQRRIEIQGQCLHAAGLDSAWMACGDDDRGRLLLGRYQVNQTVLHPDAEGADWRLALLHHPWDHLAEFDTHEARRTIHLHRDLVLRGHLHAGEAFRVLPPDPARACLELAAGCVYADSPHPNAFQWIELYPPRSSVHLGSSPDAPFQDADLFNVFLSHNSRDKPMVRQLAHALQARGLKVWLDEEQLVPGRPWQDALESIIQTTRSAAVLVGKDGLGPWEDPEMRACLSEFVTRRLPVIPVLLPDAPVEPKSLPLFLRAFTWVDLRGGLTDHGLDRVEWGITGIKPKSLPRLQPLSAPRADDRLPPGGQASRRVRVLFRAWVKGAWIIDRNQPGCPDGAADFDLAPVQPPAPPITGREPPPADPTRYLDTLWEDTANLAIRGIKTGRAEANRIPIADLYIELQTTGGGVGQGQDARLAAHRPGANPLHAALVHHRLLIIGDPGCGKTTFLRWVAHCLAADRLGRAPGPDAAVRHLGLERARLPLLVRITDWLDFIAGEQARRRGPARARTADWLIEFLADDARGHNLGLGADDFRRLLNAGDAMILLDGLDEAPDQGRRRTLVEVIECVARAYRDCPLVVTSRPAALQEETLLSGFVRTTIDRLDPAAIARFLGRWSRALFPDSERQAEDHRRALAAALDCRPEIRRLARNAVMLTALAVVHWNDNRTAASWCAAATNCASGT